MILRNYPLMASHVVQDIPSYIETISNGAGGKGMIAWLLGEFSNQIEDAPYLFEELASNYKNEDDQVKFHLLDAGVRLFLAEAPKMLPIFMKLLEEAVEDDTNPDIHDRALFLVRRLSAPQGLETMLRLKDSLFGIYLLRT